MHYRRCSDREGWKESRPHQRFYRAGLRELSPVFPEREKRGNYHRRIVYGRDKGVCRGHVARARSRDARRCQARTRVARDPTPVYLFK